MKDLVAIREKRGLTPEELQRATKINLNLIEQFEQTALVDHPLFNELYQRAILRSYAAMTQISEDLLVEAFIEALGGSYRRQLAVAYLGLSEKQAAQTAVVVEREEVAVEELMVQPRIVETVGGPIISTSRRFQFRPAGVENSDIKSSVFQNGRVGRNVTEQFDTARKWLVGALTTLGESIQRRALLQWGGFVSVMAVGAFLIVQFVIRSPESGEANTQRIALPGENDTATMTAEPLPADPVPAPVLPAVPEVKDSDIVLTDSISIFVIAEKNNLSPFRVQIDRDLRRPYWLEQGDTLEFVFANRIAVQDRLEDMKVMLHGVSYPLIPADTSDRVIISRDSVRSFLAENRIRR